MKDLEIRGAGNLLGGEQSGHIADVGFDLYVRLVGEAARSSAATAAEELRRGQNGAPGRRAPAARLHRERAAAPGDVPRLAEVRADEDEVDVRDECRPVRRAAGPVANLLRSPGSGCLARRPG